MECPDKDSVCWIHNPQKVPLVDIRINLIRITKVDTVNECAHVSLQVIFYWNDERLVDYKQTLLPPKLWCPGVYPLNFIGNHREKVVEVQIVHDATGRLKKIFQFDGMVDSKMDLTHFPLDFQEIGIFLEVDGPWRTLDGTVQQFEREGRAYRARPVKEAGEGKWITMWWDGDISEWILHGISTGMSEMPKSAQGQTFSKIEITAHITRKAGFYFRKTLLPLYLLTFLSYSTFMFPTESLEDRMANVATFFLACFSMLYVVGESLPKTDELTKIDNIIMLSTISLAAIGTAACAIFKTHTEMGLELAELVNKWCGICISSVYVIVNLWTFIPATLEQMKVRAEMDSESFISCAEGSRTYQTLDSLLGNYAVKPGDSKRVKSDAEQKVTNPRVNGRRSLHEGTNPRGRGRRSLHEGSASAFEEAAAAFEEKHRHPSPVSKRRVLSLQVTAPASEARVSGSTAEFTSI
jgi:hypothetical protein